MHFVLTTPSFTLTANFVPCLVWSTCSIQADEEHVWNQHPDHPNYDEGDLEKALEHFEYKRFAHEEKVQLIIHVESGQVGEKIDLARFLKDVAMQFGAFEVKVLEQEAKVQV